jgi:hypothetical protein
LVSSAGKVREKTIVYIWRIDKLTEPKRLKIVKNLKELDKPELISEFHPILFPMGYEFPSPVSSLEIEDVCSYGRELTPSQSMGGDRPCKYDRSRWNHRKRL